MNQISTITIGKDALTTDEAFAELLKHGKPRLSKQNGGWYANIEMFVTGEGVDFTIKTGFDEDSPNAAVNELLRLTVNAITKLKEIK